MNMNLFIFLDVFDQHVQFFRYTVAGSRAIDLAGLAAQLRILFDNVCFISLARQTPGRGHAGYAPADDHRSLIDLEFGFLQRGHQGDLVNRHANQVLGLLSGQLGIVFMHP